MSAKIGGSMERTELSQKLCLGSKLPNFSLPATSGDKIDQAYFADAKAALVIFTCNHCPYVKGSELALNTVIAESQAKGLKVVAISSNDAVQYPDDNFESMCKKSQELKLTYPYLYDESQEVAKIFDAACTPECYLFNSDLQLVFHGTINDSPRDPTKATKSYLKTAIEQVLDKGECSPAFIHPIGCSIKWK
jgi:peroxiredoxin